MEASQTRERKVNCLHRMSRVVRPPPRVNGGGSAGLPHALPPPRIDYLQARYDEDGLSKADQYRQGSSSSSSSSSAYPSQLSAPLESVPPEPSPTPGQESAFDFDADVQREMVRLENELKKQLEQEEQLMALNTQNNPAPPIPSSQFPDISPRSSYDKQASEKMPMSSSPMVRYDPTISVVEPTQPPAPSYMQQGAATQQKLSFDEWMSQNYPE